MSPQKSSKVFMSSAEIKYAPQITLILHDVTVTSDLVLCLVVLWSVLVKLDAQALVLAVWQVQPPVLPLPPDTRLVPLLHLGQ